MHDEDGCRDKPEFMFPGTGEQQKQYCDLKELLKAGTTWDNGK